MHRLAQRARSSELRSSERARTPFNESPCNEERASERANLRKYKVYMALTEPVSMTPSWRNIFTAVRHEASTFENTLCFLMPSRTENLSPLSGKLVYELFTWIRH